MISKKYKKRFQFYRKQKKTKENKKNSYYTTPNYA